MLIWVSRGVFSLWVHLRVLLTLFPMLLIHSAFQLCSLRSPICSKIVLSSYHPVIGMCWCIHPSLIWNVLFCFYCFILSRYLFSFPFFLPVPTGSFQSTCMVWFICVVFSRLVRVWLLLSFKNEDERTSNVISAFSWSSVYIYIYIILLNTLSGGKGCLVAPGVPVSPWATETVLSPLVDEGRLSHVLSHVVWWK